MKLALTITATTLAALAIETLAAYIWFVWGPWPEPNSF